MTDKLPQEVVYIGDGDFSPHAKERGVPTKDQIYTVDGYRNHPHQFYGCPMIFLNGFNYIGRLGERVCFVEFEYAPVCDISELTEILNQQPQEV